MSEWCEKLQRWAGDLHVDAGSTTFLLQDAELVPLVLAQVFAVCSGRLCAVVSDSTTAERVCAVLATYQEILGDSRPAILVPEVTQAGRHQWVPENESARCAALEAALSGRSAAFVMSVHAYLTPTLAPGAFARHSFELESGCTNWSPERLAARLVELDYDNEYEVHVPGEFARRGGILDVFSPLDEAPVRIEFFGDEIDSIRFFDPETQRSSGPADRVRIVPRGAILADPAGAESGTLRHYFAADSALAVCDPAAVLEHLAQFADATLQAAWSAALSGAPQVFRLLTDLGVEAGDPGEGTSACRVKRSDCVTLGPDFGALLPELGAGAALWHWQQLRDHLVRWHAQGYGLVACCGGEGEISRVRELLAEDPKTAGLPMALEAYRIDQGVLIPSARLVLLSEKELFGRCPAVRRRGKQRYRFDLEARDSAALEEGQFAVHAVHGICIYHGLREVEVGGEFGDVMELEFADDVRLFVPLDQAHLVGRYLGGTRKMPRLSKIGGASWKAAREAAADAAWDLAAELLRLDAVRQNSPGFEFRYAGEWEHAFASAFPYAETDDQKAAIAAVLADMERAEPMDRLVCGDVGYGKTEVALRAAFRAVLNGRQVAVLVPTTVLAQQHFATFRARLAEYPVEVEMISRFRTRTEQSDILERLARGQVDIVIGTHRLLQDDVSFHDLGLVVIDEEQRFGVRHKQRFKELRASVDILTMTATPIPRTLYFSLAGIRNLSTIMTAPAERLPITTVVAHFDRDLIRQVVLRELERKGQVYFLHNRVQTIERVAGSLRTLIPEVRVEIAHGQLPAGALEEVMARFMTGGIDVLVCTTIIESGLDIPNANTIVIDRADRFGLAELYQLRGRVGRYHHQAYAYLLLPPMGALPANARERLAAIRRYTHLGAGFKLALRDLEIRGAGNILGTEQSGHIAAVGFELYCKLLNEAVAQLSARQTKPVERAVPVHLDTLVLAGRATPGKAAAGIPKPYVGDEEVRLDCYRRLHGCRTVREIDCFEEELVDRFGPVPAAVTRLLQLGRIRVLAKARDLVSVAVRGQRVFLETAAGLRRDAHGRVPQLAEPAADGQLSRLIELLGGCLRR